MNKCNLKHNCLSTSERATLNLLIEPTCSCTYFEQVPRDNRSQQNSEHNNFKQFPTSNQHILNSTRVKTMSFHQQYKNKNRAGSQPYSTQAHDLLHTERPSNRSN